MSGDRAEHPDPAHPERDASWDERARHETPAERLDRNWGDLLQELRVVQTGVQFLTGFLLTLPFQQKFGMLTGFQRDVYLATVAASVVATAFLQAPVSVHRALFRRHERRRTVLMAHRLAVVGLCFLACAIIGVAEIVFAVVGSTAIGLTACAVTACVLAALWLVLPRALRRGPDADDSSDGDGSDGDGDSGTDADAGPGAEHAPVSR